MKLWDEHKDQQDKFAIIAIHNPHKQAPTFEKLDALLESRGTLKKWGQNLPFTVALDNSGETVKTYGIEAYPTQVLIDPDGNVVAGGSEHMLEQKLNELKEAAETK
ncbi:MAG: TlpA family protein disulfide reductase [Planctomycetes bacterium]|nr:TlpA family protein disulfide reductase [Planctomycetota bacterium]